MLDREEVRKALERVDGDGAPHSNCQDECGVRVAYDAARAFVDGRLIDRQEIDRDKVDPFVAETLYEEHIAHNVDARGGTATADEWPSWDELGGYGRDHWLSMAVAARLGFLAAVGEGEQ